MPVTSGTREALVQIAGWLRRFRDAALDFDPG